MNSTKIAIGLINIKNKLNSKISFDKINFCQTHTKKENNRKIYLFKR